EPGTYTYDTDDGTFRNQAGEPIEAPRTTMEANNVRAIWFDGVEIRDGAILRVIGPRPLMIVSTDDIHIRGTIDVSSKVVDPLTAEFSTGAGASPTPAVCTSNGAGAQ